MEADMFAKVKRINILSRSMEADMFAKVKRIDILSRSMEADMFAKVKRINILSRSMEADMFTKVREAISSPQYGYRFLMKDWCHLSILFCSVHRHGYLFHFKAPKLMFLASYSVHFVV